MTDPISLRGHLPPGVQDLFLAEAALRRHAEALLRELFSRWAYQELIPPTFEYSENLTVGAGVDLCRAIYRFFDREGHTLALRADFTTQVARIAAGRRFDAPIPLRCFYMGSVFRHEEPQAGRQREFTQAGVELIGPASPAADAEVVALAVAALDTLGLVDFQINLGQMALLRALTGDLPPVHLAPIRQALDRRNQARLHAALDAAGLEGRRRTLLARLPLLMGGPEVLDEALDLGGAVADAADTLGQVFRRLQAYGVAGRVVLDLGQVRGMEYYTGITFRGLVPELGRPVLSGGRYDDLVARFGRARPAVGFGLGVERLLLARRQQVPQSPPLGPDLVVGACDHAACLELVGRIRAAGCRVEVDLLDRDQAALQAYARERRARRVLHCLDGGQRWLLRDGDAERTVTAKALIEEVSTWTR